MRKVLSHHAGANRRSILGIGMALAIIATLAASQAARADVVVLTAGDVLNGQVTAQSEQSVTLEHPVLGTLTLSASDVASVTIQPDEGDESGESGGAGETETPDTQSDDAPEGGNAMQTDASSAPPAKGAGDVDEPVRRGLFGTGFLQGWTREFELGVLGETGVSESLDVIMRVTSEYEDDRKRWLLDGGLMYGQEEGEQTDGEFDAMLRRDWRVPEQPVFYFAQGAYEFDNFEQWDHRVRGTGGVGYEFLDNDTYELNGRLGAGLLAEFGGSQDDDVIPEGLAGVDFSWNVREGHVFTAFNNFYPQLEDVGEFRNVTGLEYTIEIDREEGLSFKVGVENEHDSTDTTDKNDLIYFTTLIIGF
jgi:putative salt-induced outer membrane protein YdiY